MSALSPHLPIIFAAALLAFAVTPLTGVLARRLGLIDQPGLRKTHRSPVPLLGGLALYAAVVAVFVLFAEKAWLMEGAGIFGAATLLFLAGLWDDRYGMRVPVKLALQLVAAAVLILVGVQVKIFRNDWLDIPLTLFWVVGITNAVNFMDNMDGLAAGVTAVAAAFFFLAAAQAGLGMVAVLAAALFGSAVGFLFYNFAPAISFMGDAGALLLGFLLATLGIKVKFPHYPIGATWMAPLLVLGVLIFDTTLVTVSRLRRGRSPFQGGSDHTSHRLVQLGLSQPRAVLTMYLIGAALGGLALVITRQPVVTANLAFGALSVAALVLLFVFEQVEPQLSGDPPVVLLPGAGGGAAAVTLARAVSRDLTVLLAPRWSGHGVTPARAEVVEVFAALAEQPDAVRALLERGLGEEWWRDVNRLNLALKLNGLVVSVGDPAPEALPAPTPELTLAGPPQPEAMRALRRAKLILFGPGGVDGNLLPAVLAPGVRAAVSDSRAARFVIGSEAEQRVLAEWLGQSVPVVEVADAAREIQRSLLNESAARAKIQPA